MKYMKRSIILVTLAMFSCSLPLFARNKASVGLNSANRASVSESKGKAEKTPKVYPQINLPAFDSNGATYLVVDSGPDEDEGRFTIGVQVFNRTNDKKINAEVYGWGGRFKEEWHLISGIKMDRWSPMPKLFHPWYKGIDYTHYRYFAIKILKPKDNKYKIVSDQLRENLNFYIYDSEVSIASSSSQSVSVFEASAQTYVVSGDTIKGGKNDSVFLASHNKIEDLFVNLYVYNKTKKVLAHYGAIKFTDWIDKLDKKTIKKIVPLSPEEFKDGNEYDVKLKRDGLNLIIFVDN